jgi:hypothetical protein
LSGTAAEAKLVTTDLIAVHRSVSGRAASGPRETASARRFPAAPRIDLESRRRFRTSTRSSAAIGPMRSPRTSAHLAPILGGAGCTPTNSRAYGSEFSVVLPEKPGKDFELRSPKLAGVCLRIQCVLLGKSGEEECHAQAHSSSGYCRDNCVPCLLPIAAQAGITAAAIG